MEPPGYLDSMHSLTKVFQGAKQIGIYIEKEVALSCHVASYCSVDLVRDVISLIISTRVGIVRVRIARSWSTMSP